MNIFQICFAEIWCRDHFSQCHLATFPEHEVGSCALIGRCVCQSECHVITCLSCCCAVCVCSELFFSSLLSVSWISFIQHWLCSFILPVSVSVSVSLCCDLAFLFMSLSLREQNLSRCQSDVFLSSVFCRILFHHSHSSALSVFSLLSAQTLIRLFITNMFIQQSWRETCPHHWLAASDWSDQSADHMKDWLECEGVCHVMRDNITYTV